MKSTLLGSLLSLSLLSPLVSIKPTHAVPYCEFHEANIELSGRVRVIDTGAMRFSIPEEVRTIMYNPTRVDLFSPDNYEFFQCLQDTGLQTDNYSYISITPSATEPRHLPRGTSGVTDYSFGAEGRFARYTTNPYGVVTEHFARGSSYGGSLIASARYLDDNTLSIFNEIQFQWIKASY